MTERTVRSFFTAAALAIAASLLVAVACGGVTAGVPVAITLAFESLSDGRTQTVSGWDVELTEAAVLLGPVYGYAPRDETASRMLFAPPIARAHGGFDPLDGRIVRAEYLEQVAFDALGPPLEVGSVFGLEGELGEVSLVLDEPRADASATRGHHLFVAGTATRGEDRVQFEGGLDLEDEGLTRHVDGILARDAHLADGVQLVVGVDAARWLSEANFEGLTTEGIAALTPDTQAHRAWRLGARSAAAFDVRTTGGER